MHFGIWTQVFLSGSLMDTFKFGRYQEKFSDVNKKSSELMQEDFRRQKYILSTGLVNLWKWYIIFHFKCEYLKAHKSATSAQSKVHNPSEHLWDELQHDPALVANLTNTLLDKWVKIPTFTYTNLGKCLTKKWKLS